MSTLAGQLDAKEYNYLAITSLLLPLVLLIGYASQYTITGSNFLFTLTSICALWTSFRCLVHSSYEEEVPLYLRILYTVSLFTTLWSVTYIFLVSVGRIQLPLSELLNGTALWIAQFAIYPAFAYLLWYVNTVYKKKTVAEGWIVEYNGNLYVFKNTFMISLILFKNEIEVIQTERILSIPDINVYPLDAESYTLTSLEAYVHLNAQEVKRNDWSIEQMDEHARKLIADDIKEKTSNLTQEDVLKMEVKGLSLEGTVFSWEIRKIALEQ